MKPSSLCVAICWTLLGQAVAHGSHAEDEPRPEDWATFHLLEEHHISNFDAASFFTLHDFNHDGIWTTDEVRKFYGFDDESLQNIAPETKHSAVKQVFRMFDPDDTGSITRAQWMDKIKDGVRLPDFRLGPGHHGDDEYEYEIHHFEKFHGEGATEEDLTHPEDIAHFAKHDQMEDEAYRVEQEQRQSIVEANIPVKFRTQR